jgi:integrase
MRGAVTLFRRSAGPVHVTSDGPHLAGNGNEMDRKVTKEALDERMRAFETHMVMRRGKSRRTAYMRAGLVRRFLNAWDTLQPTKAQVQEAVDAIGMARSEQEYAQLAERYGSEKPRRAEKGYHPGYVKNICVAFNTYGDFTGVNCPPCRLRPSNSKEGTKRAPCAVEGCLYVERPHVPDNEAPDEDKVLEPHEIEAFFRVIPNLRDRAIFTVLFTSGVRCEELVNIKVGDVHFQRKIVFVRDGKGAKSGEATLNDACLRVVAAYLEQLGHHGPGDYLFHAPDGKRLSTARVRTLAERYGKRAGIPKRVSPHMFRHSCATVLQDNGFPLTYIQKHLRHSRLRTTLKYARRTTKAQVDLFERTMPNLIPTQPAGA